MTTPPDHHHPGEGRDPGRGHVSSGSSNTGAHGRWNTGIQALRAWVPAFAGMTH